MDVEDYLISTKDLIAEHYQKAINEIAEDIGIDITSSMTKGKHFRPILTVLCCQACGGKPENALDLAVAIELIHQATLTHDDILDKDKFRRGAPAMWLLAGVGKSILTGDASFAKALQIISKYGSKITSIGAQTIYALCKGAIKEVISKFPSQELPDPYIEIALLKTGSLFATSCHIGAISAYASPAHEEACRNYGKYLGIAYQIADDHVDLVKSIKNKDALGDLRDKRITYPLFCMYLSSDRLKELIPLFAAGKLAFSKLIEVMEKDSGGLEKSKNKIDELCRLAEEEAVKLPESEYREIMIELPRYMVERMLEECENL